MRFEPLTGANDHTMLLRLKATIPISQSKVIYFLLYFKIPSMRSAYDFVACGVS
jgi:hypothetical protein